MPMTFLSFLVKESRDGGPSSRCGRIQFKTLTFAVNIIRSRNLDGSRLEVTVVSGILIYMAREPCGNRLWRSSFQGRGWGEGG